MKQTSHNQFGRYIRQTALPEIGLAGQDRLSKAKVLCVGSGGLGSPALLYLAAAGVGTIGIAEFDTVNESNLHRQVLYDMGDIDMPKLDAAAARICAINPDVSVIKHPIDLCKNKADDVIPKYDIVIECTDSFKSKSTICQSASKHKIPVVHGAVCGFKAQVSVFMPGAACYRCLYPVAPKCRQSNAIIGTVAGITGITQAMQVIMLITPHDDFAPLVGKLWEIDSRTMQTRIFDIPKDAKCDACLRAI